MDRSRWSVAALVVLVSGIVYLAYGPTRAQSAELLIGYGAAFAAYLYIAYASTFNFRQLFVLAIGIRITLLFAPITWTDDHYRYLWDGICTTQGISAFAHTPVELVASNPDVFTPAHLALLNSPNFYSVYPPVAQAAFATATWIGGADIWRSTIVLRLLIIAFEVLTILALSELLKAHTERTSLITLYALNPLVLQEFTVNLHTELLMIAPCLWAIYFFKRERYDLSAVLIAVAASAKLWPLLFLAWIPTKLPLHQCVRFIGISALVFIASWVPFYTPNLLGHFTSSLKLYFNYLEFNGPLFEILCATVGDSAVKGSGLLSIITLTGIAVYVLSIQKQRTTWPIAMLWILGIYLFGSQVVHPWYILPLVAFAVLTEWRWPIVWSLLIVPTYLTYAQEPFTQPYWWVAIEYVLLGAFIIWEIRQRSTNSKLVV